MLLLLHPTSYHPTNTHRHTPPTLPNMARTLEQVGVASAGIVGGTAVKEGAITVMGEVGVDISGYTSDAMADFDHERSVRYAFDFFEFCLSLESRPFERASDVSLIHLRPSDSRSPPLILRPHNTPCPHAIVHTTMDVVHALNGRDLARFDAVISCCGCGDKLNDEKAVWKARALFEDWNLDGKYQRWYCTTSYHFVPNRTNEGQGW